MKKFYDYEIEENYGCFAVLLHHKEKNKNVKDWFELNDILMPYLKKKGWEYVDESEIDELEEK